MFAPIIATKLLFPPPRANLIPRPRLVERLVAGLRGPLTLVSAPAGSGKTTQLSEWRAGAGRDAAVAWLSLDDSDNEPARFVAGLAGPIPGVGIVYGWLMWMHCQRNDLEAAQEYLDQLLQAVAQMGIPEATLRAYLYQARVDPYRGRVDQAAEWIAFRGRLYLAQGDLEAAARLLEAHGVKAGDLDGPLGPGKESLRALAPRLAVYVLLARVLAAQGASPRADALLARVCQIAEETSNVEVLLQALAQRAVVAGSLSGVADRGPAHLERALDLAAPEGFARPLLDAGSALARPLRQAIMRGIRPGFGQKPLAELAEEERRRATADFVPGGPEAPGTARLIEPLIERERQVLRLLAAGLTSNEIAGELVIAVNTARSFIKSLCGKLDAHSREEAIERGCESGML